MLSDDRNAFSSCFIQVAAAAEEMKEDEEFLESCSLFDTEALLDIGTGTVGIQSSLQNRVAGTRDNAACDSSTVPVRGAGGDPTKGNHTSRTKKESG
jgi:hypothetical protein